VIIGFHEDEYFPIKGGNNQEFFSETERKVKHYQELITVLPSATSEILYYHRGSNPWTGILQKDFSDFGLVFL
jgi:hypothetical protein